MAEKQENPENTQNGEPETENAELTEEEKEKEKERKKKELEELPPFEIVSGVKFYTLAVKRDKTIKSLELTCSDPLEKKCLAFLPPQRERLPAFFFKFQFKNVEYSSGRNKTFLCYIVETQGKESGTIRGYLEDEHAAAHAEDAFFNTILPECESSLRYNVTWYVSSSPCVACAERIAEILKKNKNLRLAILVSRLFMWEEPEMQAVLKKMKAAGCKLRIMKPQDFEYVWQNFVEQEEGESKDFVPWEDIQENFLYYEEKLAEVLH